MQIVFDLPTVSTCYDAIGEAFRSRFRHLKGNTTYRSESTANRPSQHRAAEVAPAKRLLFLRPVDNVEAYLIKAHDKAISDFNEAIRLDPNFALAYNNRGMAIVRRSSLSSKPMSRRRGRNWRKADLYGCRSPTMHLVGGLGFCLLGPSSALSTLWAGV